LNSIKAALRHRLVSASFVFLVAVVEVQQLLVELHLRRVLQQLLDGLQLLHRLLVHP